MTRAECSSQVSYDECMLHPVRLAYPVALLALFSLTLVGCSSKKKPPRPSAERWAQIQEWAKSTVKPGDSALIDKALEEVYLHEDTVHAAWQARNRQPLSERPADETRSQGQGDVLPEAVEEAVDALIAWAEARDGLELTDCTDTQAMSQFNLAGYMTLIKAVQVRAAQEPRGPAAGALLYLGHRFRSEGTNLLHMLIGLTIAADVAEWAEDHPGLWDPAFATYAPAEDALVRAVSVETVCTWQMAQLLRNSPEALAEQQSLLPLPASKNMSGGFYTRQLDTAQGFNEETVFGIKKRLGNDAAMLAYLEGRVAAIDKMKDEWLFLPILADGLVRNSDTLVEKRTAYMKFLKSRKAQLDRR